MPTGRKRSDSGAYMSQYDNEVESKLKAINAEIVKLQAAVAELQAHTHEVPAPTPAAAVDGDIATRVYKIEHVLRANPSNNFDKIAATA